MPQSQISEQPQSELPRPIPWNQPRVYNEDLRRQRDADVT